MKASARHAARSTARRSRPGRVAQKAQALILAGSVLVNGQKADKPGQTVPWMPSIEISEQLPFVSRGGLKLDAALTHFGIDVTGKVCLDIGAPPGGFTDCLLQRGAARVYAVDVGATQLDWKHSHRPARCGEGSTNARHLTPGDIGELCDIAVCDVSFISVTLIVPVIPPLLTAARRDGHTCQTAVRSRAQRRRQGRHRARSGTASQAACDKVSDSCRSARISRPIDGQPDHGRGRQQGISPACPSLRTVGLISKPNIPRAQEIVPDAATNGCDKRDIDGPLR